MRRARSTIAAQREHRGVGRQDDELAAGLDQLEPAVERRSSDGMTSSRSRASPPYVEPQAELGRALAATTMTSPARSSSGSKSTSQIHETSRPSAIASLSATTSDGRHARLERAHHLVRAGRVLDQEEDDGLAARRDPLEAAERRAEALETGTDVVERRAERERERGRASAL